MEQRRFGNSDLMTSSLGFGTWEMSVTQYGQIDVGDAARAVNAALDQGITLFDTAENYGPYTSEELLGKALGARRKEVVLVTKVGFIYRDDGRELTRCSRYEWVIERTEGCLKRLNTDYLDLLLIHWPDHNTPIAESIRALEKLKADGKIRHYGVSNFTVPMMEECQRRGQIVANQVGYHLYDRRMEAAVLPHCRENGIGFMAYGTLGFGLLTGAFTPETKFLTSDWRSRGWCFGLPLFERESFLKEVQVTNRLKELAARYGKTVAQLAIAWVLGNPAVTVGLVGCRNPREVAENVQAADWKLTAEDRAEIDRVFVELGVPTNVDAPQAV